MKSLKCFILLLFIAISFHPIQAQDAGTQDPGYIEDNGAGLWDRRTFEDATGMKKDFESGGGEYIGEAEAVEAIKSAVKVQTKNKRIDFKGVFTTEKELKYDNIKYGALTGVMIGGWMAMVSNLSDAGSTYRDNARNIGVGAVLGVLLGTAIGTKSLYEQNLRSENINDSKDYRQHLQAQPRNQGISVGSSDKGLAQLNFNFRF